MAAHDRIIWETGIELSRAWEELSDYNMPGYNYRKHLKTLRNFDDATPKNEYERQIRQLEDKERNLKIQMLSRIEYGDFIAYGRNISQSAGSEITKIPNSLFNQLDADVEVKWGMNRLHVENMLFIDIKIVIPSNEGVASSISELSLNSLNPTTSCETVKAADDTDRKSVNDLNQANKRKRGRRSDAVIIKVSIRKCYSTNPDILNLKQDAQINYFRSYIRENYPKINPEGDRFSDKTFKKYILEIKTEMNLE